MSIESNIDVLLDVGVGCFIPVSTAMGNTYYEFMFYHEIQN